MLRVKGWFRLSVFLASLWAIAVISFVAVFDGSDDSQCPQRPFETYFKRLPADVQSLLLWEGNSLSLAAISKLLIPPPSQTQMPVESSKVLVWDEDVFGPRPTITPPTDADVAFVRRSGSELGLWKPNSDFADAVSSGISKGLIVKQTVSSVPLLFLATTDHLRREHASAAFSEAMVAQCESDRSSQRWMRYGKFALVWLIPVSTWLLLVLGISWVVAGFKSKA